MGRPVNDLDFTTDARPEQVLQLLDGLASATWTTGIDFGTVGAQVARRGRARSPPSGPTGTTGSAAIRRWSSARASQEDLRRRDFTMNAMAVSVVDRGFVDPYGGLADLARGVLRTPAAPGRVVRRRSAADAAGGPVRQPARGQPSRPR